MNKKVTSLLLVFVMLFSMMATAVPAYAAGSNEFVITPDKSEASPGDTITYTVVLGPIQNFQSANFTLVIPEGLTFVSGATPEGLKELTGATEAGFENSTLTFYHGGLEAYTSDTDTVLMTFTCTVNSEAMGDYQIEIMDDWDFADSNWTTYSDMIINTAASKVTVFQKSVAATGIKLNKETLTLKVGESETLIATLAPENATETVVWSSNDENVATVDVSGKVTAIAEGNVTITAKAGDVSATCKVTTECAHTNTTEQAANASTCTEQGNNAYTTCDDCGDVISGSTEKLPLDSTNHVDTTTYPAETGSCVEPGHAEYSFCNDCKSIINGSNSPVVGHHGNYVEKAEEKYLKTAADCDTAAVYYKSCELCGEAHATETFTYGEALGHDYNNATCTAPKTCKVCGATDGKALGHSYATVWSKGEDGHWHECSACGDKIDFSTHDYGTEGDSCVICGYERSHVHRLTLVPGVDAICTVDGNKAYYTCSGCENWFEDGSGSIVISDKTSVVISALGHDLSDATCTEAAVCQREGCGHIEGTALGHSFTNYVCNNDATCTADGTKTATCDRCDATDTEADAGSAKGHDYANATCTAPKTCKVCGATDGEALGHSFTNYVSNNDATCTADGTKTTTCDRCDETDTVTDAGSAKGHDYADATCTAPKTCKVCGATEGEALGHSYATVWSKGEDGHWHECSACGDKADFAEHDYGTEGDTCFVCEYERAHVHRLTLVPGVDVTCTEGGSKAYYTCSGCEDWFEDASSTVVIVDKTSVAIAALGHDMSDATCTEAFYCQREGCDYAEGSALGHSFINYVSNNDATCTADGTKTATCDRCDATDTVADAGSAKGHKYADATCTAPKTCKVCGATEGEALGHSYATVWSKGEDGHWHECSACGDKADFAAHDYGTEDDICLICEYERAHVHRLTLVSGVDATCIEGGSKAYYTCSGCEDWFEDASGTVVISDKTSVAIAALGHDMSDATCTESSYCQCEGCEYTEGSALGHNYEDDWTYDAENHWHKCSRCDAKTVEAAHAPGAEATEETAQICTICGYEIAPALGHTHKLTKVDATVSCTEAGNIAYYTCECDKWFADAAATIEITDKDSENSDALGHIDVNEDNECDVCGTKLENNQPTAPEKPKDDVPQTGDNSNTVLWATLLILSFVGVVVCVIFSKKRNVA